MSSGNLDAIGRGVIGMQRRAEDLPNRVIEPARMRSIHVNLKLVRVLRRSGTDVTSDRFCDDCKSRILATRDSLHERRVTLDALPTSDLRHFASVWP
jgi:hypothetical protein